MGISAISLRTSYNLVSQAQDGCIGKKRMMFKAPLNLRCFLKFFLSLKSKCCRPGNGEIMAIPIKKCMIYCKSIL